MCLPIHNGVPISVVMLFCHLLNAFMLSYFVDLVHFVMCPFSAMFWATPTKLVWTRDLNIGELVLFLYADHHCMVLVTAGGDSGHCYSICYSTSSGWRRLAPETK